MNALDRIALAISPRWGLSRLRARALAAIAARHYEAASLGRRTQGWTRRSSDPNVASARSLGPLRYVARDLVRNNCWARNGLRVIKRNTVGWGISPKPVGLSAPEKFTRAWQRWAGTTECDAAGRLTFAGLQGLATRCVAESGEVLIRRRWRQSRDGLAIPLAIQVLEPDYIDTAKEGKGEEGGSIIEGIERDAIGRRVAYWLFDDHPGSSRPTSVTSKRVSASQIAHVLDVERAGSERGVTWFAAAIAALHSFDEYEDAELEKQKIASFIAGVVTDPEGLSTPALGPPGTTSAAPGESQPRQLETLETGTVAYLRAGQEISFTTPPSVAEGGFSTRTLRRISAGLGITYEDLTNDYSQVNFSSARMSRLAHWANVYDWQWNMLVPQFCDAVWGWAMEAAAVAGLVPDQAPFPTAEWTPQPMPLIEPDREARANLSMMRSGQKTLFQVLRETGVDPQAHIAEIAEGNALLDSLKIWLDSDVRRVSQAGLTQERAGQGGGGASQEEGEKTPPVEDEEKGRLTAIGGR